MAGTSSNKNYGCVILIIVIILFGLGQGIVRYLSDNPKYNQAHAAYLTGDCGTASPLYEEITGKFRLLDFGKIKEKSNNESWDCELYVSSAANGLSGIYQYTQNHKDKPLAKSAGSLVTKMINNLDEGDSASEFLSAESCKMQQELLAAGLVTKNETLPKYLYYCAKVLLVQGDIDEAYTSVVTILEDYPANEHTGRIWDSLNTNTDFCPLASRLDQSQAFANRVDSYVDVYLGCGDRYSEKSDYSNALAAYEPFLEKYPDHPRAEEVYKRVAELLVAQANATGAGTIERPDSIGSAPTGVARVVVQNDSPHPLKIVFSGSEARIETLPACTACSDYSTIGPMYCPEMGPIGTYDLTPGTFEVLVETINEDGVSPFTGTWNLPGGNEFYSCFFVVTTWN
jgi:tetratricopeptide (TPR) repeat protein